MEDTRLGPLLLQGGVVDEADLERCLEIQTLTGGSRHLGQILIEQSLITPEALATLLELQQERRVRKQGGLLSPEELDALMSDEVLTEEPQLPLVLSGKGCEKLLETAVGAGASEIVLSENRPPMVRIADQVRALHENNLLAPDIWHFMRQHMGDDSIEELAERKSISRPLHAPGIAHGRIMAFRHFDGACVVARLQPEKIRTPDEFQLDPRVLEDLRSKKGLVLLTGQMGSGITSAIATMLAEVVKGGPQLVVVMDEDLEVELPESKSIVVSRQVGNHAASANKAIESAIRMNPDVLVIGDASEPATFDLAVRAAESGARLVIAAIHGKSIRTTLQRVFQFYSGHDIARLRSTLASVLSFVLRLQPVPRADGRRCAMATELLYMDQAARALIRDKKLDHMELLLNMEGTKSGHALEASLEHLLMSGVANMEDCFQLADNKSRILKHKKATPA